MSSHGPPRHIFVPYTTEDTPSYRELARALNRVDVKSLVHFAVHGHYSGQSSFDTNLSSFVDSRPILMILSDACATARNRFVRRVLELETREIREAHEAREDVDRLIEGLPLKVRHELKTYVQRTFDWLSSGVASPVRPSYVAIAIIDNAVARIALRRALHTTLMIEFTPLSVVARKIPSPQATDDDSLTALAA